MTTITKIRKMRRDANRIIKAIPKANKANQLRVMYTPHNTINYRNILGRAISKFSREMRMAKMPK